MSMNERDLRDALGRFATGVCLVTTVSDQHGPMAMTVNSFSSASLEPPLVLWNLQNSSEVFDVYSEAQRFAVNVLSDQQQELCTRYARKGNHDLDESHYGVGRLGVPVIPDALACFECTQATTYPAGDHLIILGRIEVTHIAPEGEPLVFCGGSFRLLAEGNPA